MDTEEKTLEEQLAEQREQLVRHCDRRVLLILEGLRARLGDGVIAAVEDLVAERTREQWAQIAEREGSNTIDDLIRVLWEPAVEEGFEFTVERREDGVQMRCTRCPIHERAKGFDEELRGWFYTLACSADPSIVAGFNPRMGFRRTKTLVEGDDHCDHFYYMLDGR